MSIEPKPKEEQKPESQISKIFRWSIGIGGAAFFAFLIISMAINKCSE